VRRQRPVRSLAVKFCWFSAALVAWAYAIEIVIHLLGGADLQTKHVLFSLGLVILVSAIARVSSRVFIRPLVLLNDAIASVRQGNLEPIRLSSTGDEIEQLGESFNQMIEVLAASRCQVREHQAHLEQKIQERTQALEESRKRAEAASRAKSEFLAGMSHELRTPLNGVLGMLDIALDGELSASQREDLETAKELGLSLLALVNDILDLAKIEAGKMTLEGIRFSPEALADGCCKSLAARARQKGLDLTREVEPGVPRYLLGDPLRLHQVLVNLLGNAVKYTQSGSVRLRVSSGPAPASGKTQLRFDVEDTGIGIPNEKLSLIFEKFTQADSSITRRYGGTGLGLSICKQLVELHGGRIWAESTVGLGSAFHVALELPEAPPPSQEIPVDGLAKVAAPAGESEGAAMARILVVEDNPTNQKVVADLLGKRGYEVSVVSHGRQALETLEESPFDLVLMDIQMPVLDGLEATRLIRRDARWRSLPIVALTAHAMVGDCQRCMEAGMNDYLAKPVRPAALLETVKKYVPAHGAAPVEPHTASRQAQVSEGLDVVGLGKEVH
jgi:signal transduction histidine kinase/CheY-like chemotaxis protein